MVSWPADFMSQLRKNKSPLLGAFCAMLVTTNFLGGRLVDQASLLHGPHSSDARQSTTAVPRELWGGCACQAVGGVGALGRGGSWCWFLFLARLAAAQINVSNAHSVGLEIVRVAVRGHDIDV